MNLILILYAFAGIFLFAGLRQIIIGVLTVEKKANITLGLLSLLWLFYEYCAIRMYNSKCTEEYMFFFKSIWIIPSLGVILQMIFVSFYTNIFNKSFFIVVLALSTVNLILTLVLPCSAIFDRIIDFYIASDSSMGSYAILKGSISPLSCIHYIFIVSGLIYIFIVLIKYYRLKKTRALVLMAVFGFRLLLIFFGILCYFRYSTTIMVEFSNVTLLLVVSFYLSYDLKTIEIDKIEIDNRNELKLFQNKIFSFIEADSMAPIKVLSDLTRYETKEEMIVKAKANSSVILNHVMAILNVYKYNEKGIQLNKSEHNFNTIICDFELSVESLLNERNIILESNSDADYWVDVDFDLIKKVLKCILHAAVNYVGVNQKIILSVKKENDETIIARISSNKPNISYERIQPHLERLFDGAFINDFSSSYSLSFCKTAITAHKGSIGFDFVNDCASIWFTLPVACDPYRDPENRYLKSELCYDFIIDNRDELNKLSVYYTALIETNFYEITKLRNIISEIEQCDFVNAAWFFELKSSIATMDEEKYFRLIDMIKP